MKATQVRPRVEGAREDEILDATLDLLIEVGYDRLTMDAVAKQARASKATLYRRWESKPALVIDALLRAKGAPQMESPDTGSLRSDLIATFCGPSSPASAAATRVLGAVVTALTNDDEFAEAFRAKFIAPKLITSAEVYARAIARGEIRSDLDLEVIAPALAGILMHRTFVLGVPTDDTTIERVIDSVILPAVLAPRSRAPEEPTTHTRTAR